MLKELLSIFRADSPIQGVSDDFRQMLATAQQMLMVAGEAFWTREITPDERTRIYKQDVQVNRYERAIRKQLVAHLAGGATMDVPYCLTLMSLVKDVERLGDYAKNLVEVTEFVQEPLPDHPLTSELREIRSNVEAFLADGIKVFHQSDREQAISLVTQARSVASRCDELVRKIARGGQSSDVTVTLVLGTRFYKRIQGHLINVVSSVIMPLHKLDFFDERDLSE